MPGSAFIGQPAQSSEDYWIARSFLKTQGKTTDPSLGAKVPPLRPPPNRYHYETIGPSIIAGCTVSMVIMFSITVLRLILRWRKAGQKFGSDDWMIIPGVFLAIMYPLLQIIIVEHAGGGKHIYDVTYHQFYVFDYVSSVDKMVFYFAVALIKMSMTLFNMRLTGLSSPRWMIVHWIFIGFLACYILLILFINVFQCNPVSANFSAISSGKLPTKAHCLSDSIQGTVLSVIHIMTDFCLLSVPIIVLWKVQIDWKAKARLYIVFSFGAISCIASVLRQIALGKLTGVDPILNFNKVLIWALVELCFGVIAASLPVLSNLLPRSIRYISTKRSQPTPNRAYASHSNVSATARGLHAKDSQEGIVRQDEIELEYSSRGGEDSSDLAKHSQPTVHTMSGIADEREKAWHDSYALQDLGRVPQARGM